MRLMKRPAILSLTTLFALASPALAHPHVFADIRSELMLAADGTVTGVRVQWTTDKAYAQVALEGMDTNGDGQYDDAELARLTEENLTALADYDYFVHFKFNGEKQAHGVAADGMQRYNPEDGRLTLVFTVPLRTPLDPHKGEVSLKVYDPEFYIDFEYVEEKPLLLSAAPPAAFAFFWIAACGWAANGTGVRPDTPSCTPSIFTAFVSASFSFAGSVLPVGSRKTPFASTRSSPATNESTRMY